MKCNMLRRLVTGLVVWLGASLPAQAAPSPNAAILLYHHVSTETPASTSIAPEQFAQHLAYLDKHHTVLPLTEVISALQNDRALPDNAVAITFDDGFENILTNAHPLLKQYGFPYTIFINPDTIGARQDQLSWDQVRHMAKQNVTFANHTLDHLHMLAQHDGESQSTWLARVWGNVQQAQQKLEKELDAPLKMLAYPFGEYNNALADKAEAAGYVAFGQHSGPVGPHSDLRALPRFAAAGPYAKLDSLRTKLTSLAMPVTASSMADPQLAHDDNPKQLTLTLAGEDVQHAQLSCYYNGERLSVTGGSQKVTVDLPARLPVGRSRVNCTAPSKQASGRYYWYSQPFFRPAEDGRYPD